MKIKTSKVTKIHLLNIDHPPKNQNASSTGAKNLALVWFDSKWVLLETKCYYVNNHLDPPSRVGRF